MYHIKSQAITKNIQYKLLSSSIVPRAIAWVTTQNTLTPNKKVVVNAAPFSFFSGISNELPLVSLAILRQENQMKDTAKNLIHTKEGVIHLVTKKNIAEMNASSAPYSSDCSEVSFLKLETTPSHTVCVPSLKKADIRLEVKLYTYIPIKDRNKKTITDLFILEVTDFFFSDSIFDKKKHYVLNDHLHAVGRLSGPHYAFLNTSFSLKRPSL